MKAHVIPEAFFRQLRDGQIAPLLVAGAKGERTKKAPIGVYDPNIVCAKCEAKFLQWDTYGVEVLLTRFSHFFQPVVSNGAAVAYESERVQKQLLLNFLVSVLWRASVSCHPFYQSVALGPYETSVLNEMILGAGNAPDAFDAVLSRWSDEDDERLPTTGLLDPHREKWGDVNAYRLYLGKVVAYLRVDQRAFKPPFAALSLRASGPCRVVTRRFSNSKDLVAMRKTVFNAERNKLEFGRRLGRA